MVGQYNADVWHLRTYTHTHAQAHEQLQAARDRFREADEQLAEVKAAEQRLEKTFKSLMARLKTEKAKLDVRPLPLHC